MFLKPIRMKMIAFHPQITSNCAAFYVSILFVGLFPTSILSAQNVGIGTNSMPYAKLHVTNDLNGNESGVFVTNYQVGSNRFGVVASIKNNNGAGVLGDALDSEEGVAPFELGRYGVMGRTGSVGAALGAFTVSGVGLRTKSSAVGGTSIYATGKLRFDGIGESNGYVLTTDNLGNATWKSLVGTHNHYGEVWVGSNANGLTVTTTADAGSGLRAVSYNANSGNGVIGTSQGNTGRGLLGISSPEGHYHPLPGDESAGVMGVSGLGAGVYAASTAGTSLHAVKMNFGIAAGSVGIFENQKTGLTTPVVRISGVSNQPALELQNGYLKVSGSTRTVFQIITGTGNTVAGNQVRFSYPGMSTTDMLIVTHSFTGAYVGAVGVWYYAVGGLWTIYREDLAAMPVGEKFNVMVVKQ
jgi:hypothetical protein